MKSTNSKPPSLSRFSINSVLRRHKRTWSLPEPTQLNSGASNESIVPTGGEAPRVENTRKAKSAVGGSTHDEEVTDPKRQLMTAASAKKLDRYADLLGLSKQETILKVCPCFLVSDLLLQGCLVVTDRHVCFCSSIFGVKRNKKIKFEEIVHISKEKVYALFPTGIGVRTRSEKVTFSSATSRDKLVLFLREQRSKFPTTDVDEDDLVSLIPESVGGTQSPAAASGDAASAAESADHPEGCAAAAAAAQTLSAPGPPRVSVGSQWSFGDPPPPTATQSQSAVANDATPPSPVAKATDGSTGDIRELAQHGEIELQQADESPTSSESVFVSPPAAGFFYNRPALTVIAVVLTVCTVATLSLAIRMNSMQQQLMLISSTRSQQSSHGSSSMDYDKLDEQFLSVLDILADLRSRLLQLKLLLLHQSQQYDDSSAGHGS